MLTIKTVDLTGVVPTMGAIQLLRAETVNGVGRYIPFALVRYARNGKEQELGVRLDLDKRAFLDRFDDDAENRSLQLAAPKIAHLIGKSRSRSKTSR